MSKPRQAVMTDFIMPEFRDKNPEDYEIREDGKVVRKDRWETTVRRLACLLEMNTGDFECHHVFETVEQVLNLLPDHNLCCDERSSESIESIWEIKEHQSIVFGGPIHRSYRPECL